MTQTMVYWVIGLLMYTVAYLVMACSATAIWSVWALHKAGEFWEWNLNNSMRYYFPKYWYFMRYHNWAYSLLYRVLWPIMVPVQMTMMTKGLKRLVAGYYWN